MGELPARYDLGHCEAIRLGIGPGQAVRMAGFEAVPFGKDIKAADLSPWGWSGLRHERLPFSWFALCGTERTATGVVNLLKIMPAQADVEGRVLTSERTNHRLFGIASATPPEVVRRRQWLELATATSPVVGRGAKGGTNL
jgi:hypothetical protein